MPVFKGESFQDRQSAVIEAKKALLEKFKSRPGPDDPAVKAREAERLAVAQAREKRLVEREAQRKVEAAALAARKAADEAARVEAERLAEITRIEGARVEAELDRLGKEEAIAKKAEEEAAKKADRDARYAARKARKIERKNAPERMW